DGRAFTRRKQAGPLEFTCMGLRCDQVIGGEAVMAGRRGRQTHQRRIGRRTKARAPELAVAHARALGCRCGFAATRQSSVNSICAPTCAVLVVASYCGATSTT